jgi:tetratricopeptide (TPR) repeat protein
MAKRTDDEVRFDVVRMVASATALSIIPDEPPPPRYRLPSEDEGAERQLALGDPLGALDIGKPTNISLRVRALVLLGRSSEAEALLAGSTEANAPIPWAAIHLQHRRLGDAKKCVERVLAADPTSLPAALLQAQVMLGQGDIGGAADLLSEVARSDAHHAVARHELGQLILAAGDPARAGTLFEQAGALNRGYLEPTLALVQMLAESRQIGEALAQLQHLAEDNPGRPEPRHLQVRLLLDIGESDTALSLARLMSQSAPQDVAAGLLLAEALLDREATQEAMDVLQRLPAGDRRSRIDRLLARAELQQGHADAALQRLRNTALQLGPDDAGEVWIEVIQIAAAHKRTEMADEGYVALTHSTDLNAVVNGALLARQAGAVQRARKLGERAKQMVAGTSSEHQIDLFLQSLPRSTLI